MTTLQQHPWMMMVSSNLLEVRCPTISYVEHIDFPTALTATEYR